MVLSGISLILVSPANATPAVQNVTGNDIRSHESPETYVGWHEGYNNATRAYFVASDGLHFGNGGVNSQILNGSAPEAATSAELETRITTASVAVATGDVSFQIPLFFGPGITQSYTTLRPATPIATPAVPFSTSDNWVSSFNIPNTGTVVIAKNVPTPLSDILAALHDQGSLRLLGFGVQANTDAVVTSITYNGTEYVFTPHVAAAPSSFEVVNDRDLLGPEDNDPNSAGFNYEDWHEGKTVDSSTVKSNGLNLGSPGASTVIKGTTVIHDQAGSRVTQAQLQDLITNARLTVTSGSTNFQIPVHFDSGLSNFATLLSENFTAGTHTFSMTDKWRVSRAFGPYAQFQQVVLGDLLDTLFSSAVSGGEVWVAGFGAQADNLAVIPNLIWDGTEYTFYQPETQVCTATAGPIATNQDSQGWTFGTTRALSHNDFVADGIRVSTEDWSGKAGALRVVDVPLKDAGTPEINYTRSSPPVGADIPPGIHLYLDLDGNGTIDGLFIKEASYYGDTWWYDGDAGDPATAWIRDAAPHTTGGNGSPWWGSLNEWLVPFPNAVVKKFGFALGGGVYGDFVVHSFTFGCTEYTFVADPAYDAPSSTEYVNDTQIRPDEATYPGWHEGYTNASRAYTTKADGLHLGVGFNSQIMTGFDSPMVTTDLESLVTSAGFSVLSGTSSFQIPLIYGDSDTFTTLRSLSLPSGADQRFGVTDTWVSSRALVDNSAGTIGTTNATMPMADLVAFIQAQGNVRVLGVGVQADSPAVVQDVLFNGVKTHFVQSPVETTCGAPDFGNGKYEVHLGRGLGERNMAAVFTINSFGGLVDADDPSDTLAEIQGYGLGWINTYIRTKDEVGHDFSNGYVITYTFVDMIVTGTVTIGADGCNSLVWTYTDTQIVAGFPTISGTAKVGQTLTADAVAAGWTPASGLTFGYQWKADGIPIVGADASTYVLTAAELGKTITVEVTGSKTNYKTASNTSLGTAEVLNDHIVVERLAGSNRYATAVDISGQFASATRVYIANGLGYADALSAGPAAAHFNAPLLLTAPDALPAIVVTELNRLQPSEIVIVGGEGVVSPAVQTALENLAFAPDVRRVSGTNRYATSRAIATDTWGPGSLGTAYLATGTDFPDALSAAPAAAHFDGPVVLVPGMATSVDAVTMAMLSTLGVDEIKIAGGTGVVSTQIQNQMNGFFGAGNVTRNGGTNRFLTSVAINADEFSSVSTVYLAQGFGFPDALAGAAIAGSQGAPLFASMPDCIPQAVMDAITALNPQKLVLLGGTGVLSANVESMTVCS